MSEKRGKESCMGRHHKAVTNLALGFKNFITINKYILNSTPI